MRVIGGNKGVECQDLTPVRQKADCSMDQTNESSPRIQLSEPTTEVFPETSNGKWATTPCMGHKNGNSDVNREDTLEIIGSLSRLSPLLGIEEEGVDEDEEEEKDIEEAEITDEREEDKKTQKASNILRGTQPYMGGGSKNNKKKVVMSKDLKFAGMSGVSRKPSSRK
ncbi:unnamed protein product [Eruca vesicaria subsp. sativa]|uniref:Uncharacterized protein n=1 Tax=Eruca vesicaria subsp. sativa TaxID=29727 RepID=A0ABC8L5J3_ERUVS|nr:unnamed protein product [Eruca vesicaria subsp. sativa]